MTKLPLSASFLSFAALALLYPCSVSRGGAPVKPDTEALLKSTSQFDSDLIVDDVQLKSTFETELGKLKDSGKTRPAAELIKELRSRTNHPQALETKPRSGNPLTRGDIYRKSLESSLIFGHIYKCDRCSKWHGNVAGGFILSPDGLAVTNYHVIDSDKAATFGAMTADGALYPVKEVVAASRDDDVAIVRLEGAEDLTPLPVSTSAGPGEEITVVSHPKGLFYTLTQGVVSRYSLQPSKSGKKVPTLEITADYAAGSSGSPIFDSRGNVTGLVKSTRSLYYSKDKTGNQKNLQMVIKTCVPAISILQLLEADAPKPKKSASAG